MPTILFLASTPLHTFWSLGVAAGAFPGWKCVLALIDQRAGDQDHVAEALARCPQSPISEVVGFPQVGKHPLDKLRHARRVMAMVRNAVGRWAPTYIVVGNDRRAEFYAALAAAPKAIGAYLDDGMYSYLPMPRSPLPLLEPLVSGWGRRVVYGCPVEHPRFVGGSRAAQEAWVLLPDQVHEGLRSKTVHRIEPDWYRLPAVRAVCETAVERSGLAAHTLTGLALLLVLPHESFLRQHPELKERLTRIIDQRLESGQRVAYKRHPRSTAGSLDLPVGDCIEIPRRLPIEVLAPLLSGTKVVGTLTTALISLQRLGENVDVRYLGDISHQASAVYRAAGIQSIG